MKLFSILTAIMLIFESYGISTKSINLDTVYDMTYRVIKERLDNPIVIYADKVKKFKVNFSVNNEEDILWLTRNIYFEGRGESDKGKLVIAIVTLNRVRKEKWPDTIKEVVIDPYQFSWYNETLKTGVIPEMKDKESMMKCKEMAILAMGLYNHMVKETWGKATFYHSNEIDKPWWVKHKKYICSIDNHLLYKTKEI